MTEDKQKQDKKGVVLLIVIGTVFIVIFLANVVLNIITSHSRLTHHQVSRIQAYYASMAGINYALEQLRTGTWKAGTDCSTLATACSPELDLSNDFKPASIKSVSIVIIKPGDTGCPGNSACVKATANYASAITP
jgi:Tfp pilus assembly protein PilX